jgi:ketosteroid isomerase-like protein
MSDINSEEARNIEVVRRLFDALAADEVEVLRRGFAVDAVFRRLSVGPLRDDFKGQQEIVDFFADLKRETNGTLRVEPLSVSASDARVLVLYRISGRRNGKILNTDHVLVFTLGDGLVTEAVMFARNFAALADFWS